MQGWQLGLIIPSSSSSGSAGPFPSSTAPISRQPPPCYKEEQHKEYKGTSVFLSRAGCRCMSEVSTFVFTAGVQVAVPLHFCRATPSCGTFELGFPVHRGILGWIYPPRGTTRKKKSSRAKHFSNVGLSRFRKAQAHRRTARKNTNIQRYATILDFKSIN